MNVNSELIKDLNTKFHHLDLVKKIVGNLFVPTGTGKNFLNKNLVA